jgi:hypothetical protein
VERGRAPGLRRVDISGLLQKRTNGLRVLPLGGIRQLLRGDGRRSTDEVQRDDTPLQNSTPDAHQLTPSG